MCSTHLLLLPTFFHLKLAFHLLHYPCTTRCWVLGFHPLDRRKFFFFLQALWHFFHDLWLLQGLLRKVHKQSKVVIGKIRHSQAIVVVYQGFHVREIFVVAQFYEKACPCNSLLILLSLISTTAHITSSANATVYALLTF